MKKLKNLFSLSFLAVFASLFFTTGAGAEEVTSEQSFKEEINGLYVEIPYDKNEVKVEKTESPDSKTVEVTVYDVETNEFLESHSVTDLEEIKMPGFMVDSQRFKEVTKTKSEGIGKIKNTLHAKLSVHGSGSFVQINYIDNVFLSTGSGMHTLEDRVTGSMSRTGTFPTGSIEAYGNATIETKIDHSLQAAYEGAGFSVGVTSTGSYYARKPLSITLVYSLY